MRTKGPFQTPSAAHPVSAPARAAKNVTARQAMPPQPRAVQKKGEPPAASKVPVAALQEAAATGQAARRAPAHQVQEALWSVSPGASAPAGGERVVQRAGTKPNQPSVDGRYRIKLSSEREEYSYQNRHQLKLNNILPQHYDVSDYTTNEAGEVTSVQVVGVDAAIVLAAPIPAPTATKKLLVIDTVGFRETRPEEEKDQKLFIDVKIGTYTKSGEQFELEGAGGFMRFFKKIEHNLKDLNRDSRGLGYDIDSGNRSAFEAACQDEAKKGQVLLAIRAVSDRLLEIDAEMRQAPMTFVGASVFIVLNLTNPGDSAASLIDPDHPIIDLAEVASLAEDEEEELPSTVGPGVMSSDTYKATEDRSWKQYYKKWRDSFGIGMVNFLRWFAQERDKLG